MLNDFSEDPPLMRWAVDIVSSYVSNNSVPAAELPNLLHAVHASLSKVTEKPPEEAKQPLTPPVPIRKSIADDYLVCLEDGKRFKSLKRHLQTVHGMSPDQYRERWSLGRDYPMVAPDYAKARSALAKGMGLGASRRAATPTDDDIVDDDTVDEALLVPELPEEPEAPAAVAEDVPAEEVVDAVPVKAKRTRTKKA